MLYRKDVWLYLIVKELSPLDIHRLRCCSQFFFKLYDDPLAKWRTFTPDKGLCEASRAGHRDLVDLFIAKGANKWNWALWGASEGGQP
jgi:hypothetical protein